jgi:hypothetical protein
MSEQRTARVEVAEMGHAPLPRKSGELVFHGDWERRSFALASRRSDACSKRNGYSRSALRWKHRGSRVRRMTSRVATAVGLLAIACIVAPAAWPQSGQSPASAAKPYTAPRTSFGQPDLSGTWTNNNATPLQRPAQWADKALLTDAELAAVKSTARQLEEDGDALFGDELILDAIDGDAEPESHDTETGNYNGFWLPPRDFERRTSLIIDPSNGRIPPYTPEAQARRAAAAERRRSHPADGPWSRGLGERCITFGVPRLTAAYSSVFEVVQSPNEVVFVMETIHNARVIPLDGRPHLPSAIPQWDGSSRGRWEGDTLVVDTIGFSPKSDMMGSSTGLHLVERFTRIAPDVLQYDATMSDPSTWTQPWTVRIPLRRIDEPLIEYACHEGNLGMVGILAGARKQEADARANQ